LLKWFEFPNLLHPVCYPFGQIIRCEVVFHRITLRPDFCFYFSTPIYHGGRLNSPQYLLVLALYHNIDRLGLASPSLVVPPFLSPLNFFPLPIRFFFLQSSPLLSTVDITKHRDQTFSKRSYLSGGTPHPRQLFSFPRAYPGILTNIFVAFLSVPKHTPCKHIGR